MSHSATCQTDSNLEPGDSKCFLFKGKEDELSRLCHRGGVGCGWRWQKHSHEGSSGPVSVLTPSELTGKDAPPCEDPLESRGCGFEVRQLPAVGKVI